MIGLDADLRAELDGLRLRVNGQGNVLICRLNGDPASLFETVRRSGRLLRTIRAVVPVLLWTGIRLDVVIGRVRVARAGAGIRQNAPARLLNLPAVRFGK